jgi:glycosyltransferase involved in cell wall biosynthesis
MRNLLYFASDFQIGLSAVLTDQLISIVESEINVVAVAGQKEQESGLDNRLKEKKINIVRIDGLDVHHDFIRLTSEIERIVLAHNIDIIHVQNNWQLAIVAFVKFKLLFQRKIEVVYTLHGFRNSSPIKSHIAQVVIGSALWLFADHVICMTKYLRRKFCLLSYKIDLIPLGINDEYFIPSFIPPKTDALHLIFPAQFREGKNQDMIIRAFADYVKWTGDRTSDVTFPGSGPLLEKMKRLANELGIESQIHFPGLLSKEEVKRAYLDSNIAVVASNSETFGQSIVEPYVLGRAVISTPVGIATEIISDGVNGMLFHSQVDLTEALLKIAKDKQLLVTMGANNFGLREAFRWNEVTKLYRTKLNLE